MTNPVQVTQAELLPCPFCGGPGTLLRTSTDESQHIVGCADCTCCIGLQLADEAVAAWNTRPDDDQQTRLFNAALQRLADQSRMIAELEAKVAARSVGGDEVERIRDALKTAYNEGATAVHYAWIDGNGQREPDFGEAASDYAASIDIAALTPASTYQEGIEDAAKALENKLHSRPDTGFLVARNEGLKSGIAAIRALGTKP